MSGSLVNPRDRPLPNSERTQNIMKIHSPKPLKAMNKEELQEELNIRVTEPFWNQDPEDENKAINFNTNGIAVRERIDTIYRIAEKRGWELE
jgi:hypothetical protein